MLRVVVLFAAALLLSACSMSTSQLSYNNTDSAIAPPKKERSFSPAGLALGGEPSGTKPSRTKQIASNDDRAPRDSFERAPKGSLSDRDYSSTELSSEEAGRQINEYRRQHGLKPLTFDVRLTEAARGHSRDLAKWDRISHYGSDGSNPWDRVKRTGYPARIAAENVGTGQSSFKEVLQGWKDSPGHNKNLLLKDAHHMGLALIKDPNTEFKTFWTLVLGAQI